MDAEFRAVRYAEVSPCVVGEEFWNELANTPAKPWLAPTEIATNCALLKTQPYSHRKKPQMFNLRFLVEPVLNSLIQSLSKSCCVAVEGSGSLASAEKCIALRSRDFQLDAFVDFVPVTNIVLTITA